MAQKFRATQTAASSSASRRIPGWASGLLARLTQDSPHVVDRDAIADYLAEAGSDREIESTVRELRRLGWLRPTSTRGVWAFLPPGQDQIADPYLELRAWQLSDPEARFALAAEYAAWHLGYIDRVPDRWVTVWIPEGSALPHGLRSHVGVVRLGWTGEMAPKLVPKPRLLRKRSLDLVSWASGLPAFGPEAILVQLATRPSSFGPWADLVAHLDQFANDVHEGTLVTLLEGQSNSAWQRAAYLLHRGGRNDARDVLARRPDGELSSVQFGTGDETTIWSSAFGVADRLVAPLQERLGKA
jgi:hypothetical protein